MGCTTSNEEKPKAEENASAIQEISSNVTKNPEDKNDQNRKPENTTRAQANVQSPSSTRVPPEKSLTTMELNTRTGLVHVSDLFCTYSIQY